MAPEDVLLNTSEIIAVAKAIKVLERLSDVKVSASSEKKAKPSQSFHLFSEERLNQQEIGSDNGRHAVKIAVPAPVSEGVVDSDDRIVLRYPLVTYPSHTLLKVEHLCPLTSDVEGRGRTAKKTIGTTITTRLSLELSLTLEEHLTFLSGVNQSEWVRDAILQKLAMEQEERKRRLGR